VSRPPLFEFERDRDGPVSRARQLTQTAGVTHPPVDIERLARMAGVKDIRLTDLDSAHACLIPHSAGHIILVNRRSTHGRQRFSIAHEIAHILLRSSGMKFRRKGGAVSNTEERLCNLLAGELLMPLDLFKRHARACDPSLDWIVELAKTFDTAIEAAAWRFGEVNSSGVEVICWERQGTSIVPRWIIGEEITRSWSPPSSLVRSLDDTTFGPACAFATERLVVSHERPPDKENVVLRLESRRFARKDPRYVLTLVRYSGVAMKDRQANHASAGTAEAGLEEAA